MYMLQLRMHAEMQQHSCLHPSSSLPSTAQSSAVMTQHADFSGLIEQALYRDACEALSS